MFEHDGDSNCAANVRESAVATVGSGWDIMCNEGNVKLSFVANSSACIGESLRNPLASTANSNDSGRRSLTRPSGARNPTRSAVRAAP